MATLNYPFSVKMRFLQFSWFLFILISCNFVERSSGFEGRNDENHFHSVEISSFFPADVCSRSTIKGFLFLLYLLSSLSCIHFYEFIICYIRWISWNIVFTVHFTHMYVLVCKLHDEYCYTLYNSLVICRWAFTRPSVCRCIY